MVGYDKDGFIQLIRRSESVAAEGKSEKKEKKSSKRPFKKGSWKMWLYKKLKKWKSSKHVSDFHFTKQINVFLTERKDKVKAFVSGQKPTDEQLKRLQKHKDDSFVLINCGEGIYTRISVRCYLKLLEVDRIAISISMICSDDAGDEEFSAYDDEQVFDNINSFLSWVNYYRQLVYGVCEVQSHMCGFMYTRYKAKTVIRYTDGSVKAFKGDFNEVLTEFDFDPLL